MKTLFIIIWLILFIWTLIEDYRENVFINMVIAFLVDVFLFGAGSIIYLMGLRIVQLIKISLL